MHIAETTARAIRKKNVSKVGLLGTVFTSKYPFYREILQKSGLSVIFPDESSIDFVNKVIYQEIWHGIINEDSKQNVLRIIDSLKKQGAQGIVLACTELPLMIREQDVSFPLFNTLKIHADAAVSLVLDDKGP